MNGFLLDTNVPSELTRPVPDARILDWVASHDELYLSVVSIGELQKGLHLLPESRKRRQLEDDLDRVVLPLFASRILPVTERIAVRWGILEAERERIGRPLGVPDGQIAATAIEHGLTLVTRNVKDFDGLGLAILNPWEIP